MTKTESASTTEGIGAAEEVVEDSTEPGGQPDVEDEDADELAEGERQEGDADEEGSDGEGSDEEGSDEDLPDWAQRKLAKANREAASYRTQLRELQNTTKDAKTPEEFAAAIADATMALERDLVVAQHGLPADLTPLVTGKTREEMEANAKTLQRYVQRPPKGDLRGGLTPDGPANPLAGKDPRTLAREFGRRR